MPSIVTDQMPCDEVASAATAPSNEECQTALAGYTLLTAVGPPDPSSSLMALNYAWSYTTYDEPSPAIFARNLARYKDKWEPWIQWYRERGESWQEIIESSSRTGGKDLGY